MHVFSLHLALITIAIILELDNSIDFCEFVFDLIVVINGRLVYNHIFICDFYMHFMIKFEFIKIDEIGAARVRMFFNIRFADSIFIYIL